MNEYRIAQISENLFIPQVRLQNDSQIFEWYGICNDLKTWREEKAQLWYCVVQNLERAKSIIQFYQRKTEKKYPIYHKP